MLLNDDVVADGETKTGPFPRWYCREKPVEHLFFHIRRHTDAVVADSNFHPIAKVFGRGRESGLVIAPICLRFALG